MRGRYNLLVLEKRAGNMNRAVKHQAYQKILIEIKSAQRGEAAAVRDEYKYY